MHSEPTASWKSASAKAIILFVVVLVIAPILASADTAELHSQIRSDLLNDPRSTGLSGIELDAMVEALAAAAVSDGVADQYLEMRNAPNFTEQFLAQLTPPSASGTPTTAILWSVIGLFLALVLLIVWRARGPRAQLGDHISV